LFADSHNILNRWKNYSCRELNLHEVNDVRQIEIYTAEPLISWPSPAEVDTAIETLEINRTPGTYQIQAELIQAGSETLSFDIHNS
jgi:hypothetical protein